MTFYSNLESKELCWSDPFYANEEADLEAAIEQGEQRENNYKEHEKLAGFQLSPPHNNLKHKEAVQASDKFMSYLEKGAIAVTEEDGIKLKFPEYVDLERQVRFGSRGILSCLRAASHTLHPSPPSPPSPVDRRQAVRLHLNPSS